ncbi:MAG TPA: hypothetical protein VF015_03740 [Acidimicrobiales bacterium]
MTSTSDPAVSADGEQPPAALDAATRIDDAPEPPPNERGVLTVGEVAGLVGVTALAAVATWSLALAQLGRHDGWVALGLGLATTAAVAGIARAVGGRLRLRVDTAELGMLAAVAVVGAFLFLPGFHYAWVDKDPGDYVAHGFAIAREGDVYTEDEVVVAGLSPERDITGRVPGVANEPGPRDRVTTQFFHLYSSLLATAHDIGGARLLFNLNPLVAIGSVGLWVMAARRAAGTLTGAITGALLLTSMMQVWQAKYPSTEIVAQALWAGALLAGVLAIQRRWAGGAFLAGVLVGTGFLARPDGFLYVLLAAAAVAVALAIGRGDRRSIALVGGLGLALPYAMWNAYVARDAYTTVNHVPGPLVLTGAIAAIIAAGLVVDRAFARLGRRYPGLRAATPADLLERWHTPIAALVCVATLAALVVFWYRGEIFGLNYRYLVFTDSVERSYVELNIRWLSWFVTMRGLAVMWLGMCVVAWRRWRAPLLALVVPGGVLLFVYLYDALVSMRLMWWVRRFIPAVVPAIAIFMAIAFAFALTRRWRIVQVAAAALLAWVVIEWAAMSLPLRHHDEMAGSWDLSAGIAAVAGDQQGVFLFPRQGDVYSIDRNAPGSLWLIFDQIAANLPQDFDLGDVESYADAFPDKPVFLVTPDGVLPAQVPADRFTRAGYVAGELVVWEETRDYRPAEEVRIPMDAVVWQFEGAAG